MPPQVYSLTFSIDLIIIFSAKNGNSKKNTLGPYFNNALNVQALSANVVKIGTWKKWGSKQGVKVFKGAETANFEADSWEDEEGKKVFLSLFLSGLFLMRKWQFSSLIFLLTSS